MQQPINFVHYEQALALKELGFDELCFGYWKSKNWLIQEKTRTDGYTHADQECSAPLYQQAFRWFREKHGYYYPIHRTTNNTNQVLYSIGPYAGDYFTYEEAELACLKNLIEIVKQQTHATTN
jgi:hypothetical protein